jgi:hypothetical protein
MQTQRISCCWTVPAKVKPALIDMPATIGSEQPPAKESRVCWAIFGLLLLAQPPESEQTSFSLPQGASSLAHAADNSFITFSFRQRPPAEVSGRIEGAFRSGRVNLQRRDCNSAHVSFDRLPCVSDHALHS